MLFLFYEELSKVVKCLQIKKKQRLFILWIIFHFTMVNYDMTHIGGNSDVVITHQKLKFTKIC